MAARPMRFLDTLDEKFFDLIRFDALIAAIRRRPALWLAIWFVLPLLPLASRFIFAPGSLGPIGFVASLAFWPLLHVAFTFAAREDMQARGRDGSAYALLVFFVPLIGVLVWISARRSEQASPRRPDGKIST